MARQADYTTLANLKALRGTASADTDDDAKLQAMITRASSWFHMATRRHFIPVTATRSYRQNALLSSYRLMLDEDLLAVTSITNGNSNTVTSAQYDLIPDNSYPKNEIRILETGSIGWTFSQTYSKISVAGVWGYHEDYASAWGDSLDTVENNPLSSSGTSITVNDADGYDDRGLLRFGVGDYLLIESEQVKITALNAVANTLTVLRGQNGTTAAAHDQNTAIYGYRQTPDVEWAIVHLANWMYEKRDMTSERMQFADGTALIPSAAPIEIRLVADRYTRIVHLIGGA